MLTDGLRPAPRAARTRTSRPGYSYTDEFASGLALILDGLEQRLPQQFTP
ncbi:hypothetical protein [Micromonospora sp. CPCC 206061]